MSSSSFPSCRLQKAGSALQFRGSPDGVGAMIDAGLRRETDEWLGREPHTVVGTVVRHAADATTPPAQVHSEGRGHVLTLVVVPGGQDAVGGRFVCGFSASAPSDGDTELCMAIPANQPFRMEPVMSGTLHWFTVRVFSISEGEFGFAAPAGLSFGAPAHGGGLSLGGGGSFSLGGGGLSFGCGGGATPVARKAKRARRSKK